MPYKKQNKKTIKYQQGGLMNILDKGSSVAMSSGNPIAMGVGGAFQLAKTLTGNFGKEKRLEQEAMKKQQEAFQSSQQQENQSILNNLSPMARYGGNNVYREMGGNIPLSSDATLLQGNSHAQGGIPVMQGNQQQAEAEGNEVVSNVEGQPFVSSAKLVNPETGNLFSEDMVSMEMNKAKMEKKLDKKLKLNPDDTRANNTLDMYDLGVKNLAQKQEMLKQKQIEQQKAMQQQGNIQQPPQGEQEQVQGQMPQQMQQPIQGQQAEQMPQQAPQMALGGAIPNLVKGIGINEHLKPLLTKDFSRLSTQGYVSNLTQQVPNEVDGRSFSVDTKGNLGNFLTKDLSSTVSKLNTQQPVSGFDMTADLKGVIDQMDAQQPVTGESNIDIGLLRGSKIGNTIGTLGSIALKGKQNTVNKARNKKSGKGNNINLNKTNTEKAGNFISNNLNTLSTLIGNSQLTSPPSPILQSSMDLNEINYDSERQDAVRQYRGATRGLRGASSQVSNNALNSLYASNMAQQGKINQKEQNENAGIQNKERALNADIASQNNTLLNQYNSENAKFNNQKVTNVQSSIERDATQRKVNQNAEAYQQQMTDNNIIDFAMADPRILKSMGFSDKAIKKIRKEAGKRVFNQ